MTKTYSQVLDDIETLVQDAGIDPGGSANSVFATAELDVWIPDGLIAVSKARPWQYKLTKTTTADSYDITLSAGDKWRLLVGKGYRGTGIEKAEHEVDQDPRDFRGLTRFADVISLELDTRPDSADSVYLYMNKIHLLQKQIGTSDDLVGAIKTLAAVGAVSLALKSLGTGTINEMTTIAIAGDTTVYYAISQATIAANEATVSIWPPLAAAAAVDAVVTLSLTASTLDMILDEYLTRWVAAKACISKATKGYSQVNQAIATIALAVTATAAIAARITQAVADVASGRTAAALGVTAITGIAARITAAFGDAATGRTNAANAITAIGEADTELDKIVTEVGLAKTALAAGNSLINTITVGGGASEYMGQAAGNISVSQGYLLNGQAYLQKSSALFAAALSYYNAGGLEARAAGEKAQEANADHANAASYYSAAAAELRASSEKAQEVVTNLRLVATRLQVSQGGLRYEEWGRRELAMVERDLLALSGFPTSRSYPRD